MRFPPFIMSTSTIKASILCQQEMKGKFCDFCLRILERLKFGINKRLFYKRLFKATRILSQKWVWATAISLSRVRERTQVFACGKWIKVNSLIAWLIIPNLWIVLSFSARKDTSTASLTNSFYSLVQMMDLATFLTSVTWVEKRFPKVKIKLTRKILKSLVIINRRMAHVHKRICTRLSSFPTSTV